MAMVPTLLPSEEGTPLNVLGTFASKPRPKSGLDCICDESAQGGFVDRAGVLALFDLNVSLH